MKKLVCILSLVLGVTTAQAADIVVPATAVGSINTHWDLVGKDVIVSKNKPYIRVETRGNCHYEYEQQCTPLPNGGMNCTSVPKWVCDYNTTLFKLPESVAVAGNEVRYKADSKDVKVGTMKSFLWFDWVTLENNIGIWTDKKDARLIIREPAKVLEEIQFLKLHKIEKTETK